MQYVILEGPDGIGKTMQVINLRQMYTKKHTTAKQIRFPYNRKDVFDLRLKFSEPQASLLLMMGDMVQGFAELHKHIEADLTISHVFIDRAWLSTLVYQCLLPLRQHKATLQQTCDSLQVLHDCMNMLRSHIKHTYTTLILTVKPDVLKQRFIRDRLQHTTDHPAADPSVTVLMDIQELYNAVYKLSQGAPYDEFLSHFKDITFTNNLKQIFIKLCCVIIDKSHLFQIDCTNKSVKEVFETCMVYVTK